jgi:peptidoglycan hydrolase-like protein with peptidoglycan-binding domain
MTRPPIVCSAAILFIGLSCSHTQTATDRPKDTDAKASEPSGASESEKEATAHPTSEKRKKSQHSESSGSANAASEPTLPLATSPAGLFKPGAAETIQKALTDRGYLSSKDQSGELDSATRRALRSFQKDNHFPATGTPDDRTVRKLGLDVANVFKASP